MNETAAKLHEVWVAWTSKLVEKYGERLPADLVVNWKQHWKAYDKLDAASKKERQAWAKGISLPQAKAEKDPRAKALMSEFREICHAINGFKPEVSWGVETNMVKSKLKDYTEEELKAEFDWFLSSELPKKLGCTIKIALSNYAFNKWLHDRGN